ncbi:MAG TPA: hypothetical protein VKE40_15080 [Gemmataceae bacterium]|nr:hypothetical protein [Gemmataceae bacterium]
MRQWFVSLAVVFAAAGVAAADEKAEAIVKKGIEAHGGADNLNKYPAAKFTIKGEVAVMGSDVEFNGDMAHVIPGKFKMNLNFEFMNMKFFMTQVLNGDKFKRTIKVGDNIVPAEDEDKDEIKMNSAEQAALQLTPLLDAKAFTIRAADDEDVNGKKAAVVVATPKTIDREIKLYFDKESGLLVKTGYKGLGPGGAGARAEVYKESYYSEFKKVNGIQVTTKLVQNHDGKKFLTATMSDYEVLEKIDDKEFSVED